MKEASILRQASVSTPFPASPAAAGFAGTRRRDKESRKKKEKRKEKREK
jgi:ribosomal protein L12E/L44/L45/RPP1/RPP2